MRPKEIGSEFSYETIGNGRGIKFPELMDHSFVFSGRTAIETVIRNESIKKVLTPSYCCDSMLEPFRKAGIETVFYPVNYINGLHLDIKIQDDIDCVLLCNYFGFISYFPCLDDFKSRGGIVIEDITHSLLSERQCNEQSDYIVASIRKWIPVLCGGYVASAKKSLRIKPEKYPSEEFIREKEKAMQDKQLYLDGNMTKEKSVFLDIFDKTNHWLAEHYSDTGIDEISFNTVTMTEEKQVKKQRRDNARILYAGLENQKNIEFLFTFENMDCPLFVPVIIKNAKRDLVRRKLIDNSIYCPVHWPRPDADCESNLYDMELSLICDQRYDENDMHRIVEILVQEG